MRTPNSGARAGCAYTARRFSATRVRYVRVVTSRTTCDRRAHVCFCAACQTAFALGCSLNGSPTCHRVRFFLPLFQVLPLFEWNLLGSKAVNFRPIMTARGLLLQTLNSVKRISFWRPILYFGLVQRELKQNGPKYKLTHSPPFSPLPFLCKISSPLSAVSELLHPNNARHIFPCLSQLNKT